jgi:UDP-N-acetylglucosamine--N-acetylmuramyl-(pentapeptide) pyrophosphoryl-undecaprenol N-acetylglucosamine transferase
MLKKYGIQAVVGMGGYVSAPMLYAARKKNIPFYLCEQNSMPGKVTRYFSRYAEAVFSTFESAHTHLPLAKKCMCVGNPIRKKIFEAKDKESARAVFNMKHCKKVILAIGGSQGAVKINELVVGLKKSFPREFMDVGIIWSTGEFSYETYKKRLQEENLSGSVFLSPFITNVGAAYRACDIAISRAGAGVMMELAAMSVPSILIPYPFAADNHQDGNADEFTKAGAAVKIANDDAVPEKVAPVLLDLLNNPMKLERMRQAAQGVSKIHAAADIATYVMKQPGAEHV